MPSFAPLASLAVQLPQSRFQLTSILNVGSGAPITFSDVRGTLNRVSRSARQTPQTSLSKEQILIPELPCYLG